MPLQESDSQSFTPAYLIRRIMILPDMEDPDKGEIRISYIMGQIVDGTFTKVGSDWVWAEKSFRNETTEDADGNPVPIEGRQWWTQFNQAMPDGAKDMRGNIKELAYQLLVDSGTLPAGTLL